MFIPCAKLQACLSILGLPEKDDFRNSVDAQDRHFEENGGAPKDYFSAGGKTMSQPSMRTKTYATTGIARMRSRLDSRGASHGSLGNPGSEVS